MTPVPKPLREPRTLRQTLRRSARKPWVRPEADKVSSELRMQVFARDGYRCLAPLLAEQHDAPIDPCKGQYGQRAIVIVTTEGPIYDLSVLQLDHVRDHAMVGKRAPSDARHLATVCAHHHLDGWATANRVLLREYLAAVEPAA